MESGLFFHETRLLQQLKARGFAPDVIYDIGASSGIWSESIRTVFPAASFHLFEPLASHVAFYREDLHRRLKRFSNFQWHEIALGESSRHGLGARGEAPLPRLDDYASAQAIPAAQVIKLRTRGAEAAILNGAGEALKSAQVLIVETWLERGHGAQTPLIGEIVEQLRRHGFSLVEFGERFFDARHRLYSVDAFFFSEALLNKKTLVNGANVSALTRRIETLTGRAPGERAPLRDVDAIVSHIEVNRKHGVGVLLARWFEGAPVVSIRSADHFGGRQDFGALALRISHADTARDAVYERVLSALGEHSISRILCVPYYADDARTAIALKEITGAPLCAFVMDDAEIPAELMGALLEKASLRLAISRELAEEYQRRYSCKIAYMPPLAPARWIAKELVIPDENSRCGAMLGNVWSARWLELLRETIEDSGVELDWYANAAFPDTARMGRSIHPQPPHDDDELVAALRRKWFAVLPSGTLDGADDRSKIARLSLPSRLIYMMASSQIPVVVVGSRETAAAKFVERTGIGVVADYDRKSFLAAVERVRDRNANLEMRRNALAIAERYSDAGAAEWIWRSLARGAPVDRRFEDL